MQLFAPTLLACCLLGSMSAVRAAPDTRPAQDIETVAPQLQASHTCNLGTSGSVLSFLHASSGSSR